MNDTEELNKYYLQQEQEAEDQLRNASMQKRERLARLLKSLDTLPKSQPVYQEVPVFEKTQPIMPMVNPKPVVTTPPISTSPPTIKKDIVHDLIVEPIIKPVLEPIKPIAPDHVTVQPNVADIVEKFIAQPEVLKEEPPIIKPVELKPEEELKIPVQEKSFLNDLADEHQIYKPIPFDVSANITDKKDAETVFLKEESKPEVKNNLEEKRDTTLTQEPEGIIPKNHQNSHIEEADYFESDENSITVLLYEKNFDAYVDKAIEKSMMVVNQHTTWFDVADYLFKNNFNNEAELAQEYASEDEDENDEAIEDNNSQGNTQSRKRRRKVGRPRKRGRPRIHRIRKKSELSPAIIVKNSAKKDAAQVISPTVESKTSLKEANEILYEKLNSMTSISPEEEEKLHVQSMDRMNSLMKRAKNSIDTTQPIDPNHPLMKVLSPEVRRMYEQTQNVVKANELVSQKPIVHVLPIPEVKKPALPNPFRVKNLDLPEIGKNTLPVHVPENLFPNTPEPIAKLYLEPAPIKEPIQKENQNNSVVFNQTQNKSSNRTSVQQSQEDLQALAEKTRKNMATSHKKEKIANFFKKSIYMVSYFLIPLIAILTIFSFPEVVKYYQSRNFIQNLTNITLLFTSLAIVWHYFINGIISRRNKFR